MKTTNRPACQFLAIRILARILDTDPEIADEYLFNYTKKWGKEKLHNLVRFLERVNTLGIPEDIAKSTLEMDLFYPGDDPEKLVIPEAEPETQEEL